MYINFWYPIAKSEDIVTYEPHRTQLLGQQLVAFRDNDGAAHVLSDVCIHRGGALGKGWVRDGTVVCPYHGWQFAGDGNYANAYSDTSMIIRCRPVPRSTVTRYRKNTASCLRSSVTCRRRSGRRSTRSRNTTRKAGARTSSWCSRSVPSTNAPSRTGSTRPTTSSCIRPRVRRP